MKYLKLLILFLFPIYFGYGQSSKIDCELTHSYCNQKISSWGKFITQLDAEISKSYSPELQFKRMMVRHLYIAHLLFNNGNSDEIEKQLSGFEKDLIQLEKNQTYAPKCIGFRSTLNAYIAVNSPVTALYYLPKSFSLSKEAIKQQPNSPYSWAEYGNLEYCYSLFVGGNFSEAIKAFNKSIAIFEKNGLATPCNWYYINTLLFLAKSYEDNKQFTEANKVYDKILKIAPEFQAIHRWKHK